MLSVPSSDLELVESLLPPPPSSSSSDLCLLDECFEDESSSSSDFDDFEDLELLLLLLPLSSSSDFEDLDDFELLLLSFEPDLRWRRINTSRFGRRLILDRRPFLRTIDRIFLRCCPFGSCGILPE